MIKRLEEAEMSVKLQVEILAQDLRHAARGFLRTPTFTLAAVFALALGAGAGTAVFSVVDRILFRSLPYPQADRLVSLGMVAPIVPQEFMMGYDYLDWRDAQAPFESLGAWAGVSDCDLNDTNPVRLRCAYVDSALLPTVAGLGCVILFSGMVALVSLASCPAAARETPPETAPDR